ncbi:hypothetical protein E2562_003436 [Oryza meyeriana var. granulata]|uniref:Uncharacterized protein n=1 Tax=Oryza meyeriana var. granulata TaxID=110450 RepID=A0A6G1EF60_9ORYZ|nr:hypothetical protein E2562_003436 [Oryza meyeriana var. granulata]
MGQISAQYSFGDNHGEIPVGAQLSNNRFRLTFGANGAAALAPQQPPSSRGMSSHSAVSRGGASGERQGGSSRSPSCAAARRGARERGQDLLRHGAHANAQAARQRGGGDELNSAQTVLG